MTKEGLRMRRRIRYRSRAAGLCLAAFASFAPLAAQGGEPVANDTPVVGEAAEFTAGPMVAQPVAIIQPVEFNPVIAAVGDRLVLAGTEQTIQPPPLPSIQPPPLPVTSMPRMVPQGVDHGGQPYDIQFQFVQDTFQPLDTQPLDQPTTSFADRELAGGFGERSLADFTQAGNNTTSLRDKPAEIVSGQTAAINATVDTGE